MPLSITFIVCQGHRVSNSFNWNVYILIRLSWNFTRLLSTLIKLWIQHFFDERTYLREIIDIFLHLKQAFTLAFSLHGGLHCHLSLMNLTLFQGHRCVININCKLYVWIPFLCSLSCGLRKRDLWYKDLWNEQFGDRWKFVFSPDIILYGTGLKSLTN